MSISLPTIPYNNNLTPSLEYAANQIDPTTLAVFGLGLIVGAVALSYFQKSPQEAPKAELQQREVVAFNPSPISQQNTVEFPLQIAFHFYVDPFLTVFPERSSALYFDPFYQPSILNRDFFLLWI